MRFLVFGFLFLFQLNLLAAPEAICSGFKDPTCENIPSSSASPKVLASTLAVANSPQELTYLQTIAQKNIGKITSAINDLGELHRWHLAGRPDNSPMKLRWEALKESFKNLQKIRTSPKLFDNKGAEEFASETYKLFPILADPNIAKHLERSLVSDEKIDKLLFSANFDALQGLQKRRDGYTKFIEDGQRPINPERDLLYTANYVRDLPSRFPFVFTDIAHSEIPGTEEKPFWCNAYYRQASEIKRQRNLNLAIDGGTIVVSLFLGPFGRLVGPVSKVTRLSTAASQGAAITLDAGYFGLSLDRLGKTADRCEAHYQQWLDQKQATSLSEFKDCRDSQLIEKITTAFPIGSIAGGSVSIAKLHLLKNTPKVVHLERTADISADLAISPPQSWPKSQVARQFKMNDDSTYNVVNLASATKQQDKTWLNHADQYWDHVSNVYKERLSLTPAEIAGFKKSSQEFSDRTILITHSRTTAKGEEFSGGVGMVVSKSKTELLPLEKANGLSLERPAGQKIAEIVRLTSAQGRDESIDLISQMTAVASKEPDLAKIYIYTSKIHERLYRKLPVTINKVKNLNDRDVLLVIDAADLKKLTTFP